MRTTAYTLLAAVSIAIMGLLLAACSRSTDSTPPQLQTTDEMMRWLATEAVDIAQKNHKTRLDYSTNSIEKVEGILGRIHDEYRQRSSVEGVQGLAMAFGAYIGETIKRSVPDAKWERDHPVGGEKSYPLHWRGGESFPCAWCYRRIVNGPENNVWHKFTILAQQRAEPGGPANGSQPIRSETNSASSAAGSRR